MEGFLRYRFGGAYFWGGLYTEGLIFGILRYFTKSKTTKDDKTICFNPFGRPRVVHDPYGTMYTPLPGPI